MKETLARYERNASIPVDRSARCMTDGSPETEGHREISPSTGQQKGYVVLTAEERAKGFVRPVRTAYIHQSCKTLTTMAVSIAETYARDPKFNTFRLLSFVGPGLMRSWAHDHRDSDSGVGDFLGHCRYGLVGQQKEIAVDH